MNDKRLLQKTLFAAILLGISCSHSRRAEAHCDTLDGPVVKDAQTAIAKKDVTPVLKWITKEDEPQIASIFKKTLAVRSKGSDAREIADKYFFETLVRLHRASEGEPFTGLKPAGTQEPVHIEVDHALKTGSIDFLVGHITAETETGIRQRFNEALERKQRKDESVESGRAYVAAYVSFLHYLEQLMTDISGVAVHHTEESQ